MVARIVIWLSAEVCWMYCCTVFLLYFYESKNANIDATKLVCKFIHTKQKM